MHISTPIGPSHMVSEADTLEVKRTLVRLGYYQIPPYGLTPYPDQAMYDGIAEIQRQLGRHPSGSIMPDGPEHDAIRATLAALDEREEQSDGAGGIGGPEAIVHVRAHSRSQHGDTVSVSAYDRASPGTGSNEQSSELAEAPRRTKSPVSKPVIRNDKAGGGHYGAKRKAPGNRRYLHQGIDIKTPPGTPVTSPVDGTIEVRKTYRNKRYNDEFTNVWVKDGEGREYGFGYTTPHDTNGRKLVRNGDKVRAGDPVGTVQDRARHDASGKMQNHIHFEIKEHGRNIDPTPTVEDWQRQ